MVRLIGVQSLTCNFILSFLVQTVQYDHDVNREQSWSPSEFYFDDDEDLNIDSDSSEDDSNDHMEVSYDA